MTVAVILMLGLLAAVNGANDVSKGVATLAGGGVTRYRTAIVWGAMTTLVGSLLSGLLADRMFRLFTSGIVGESPSVGFTLAVVCGTAGWVAIATIARLPVSTTHAIVGSLVGAGVLFSPATISWSAIGARMAIPLIASVGLSYGLSAALNWGFSRARASGPDCLCVGVAELDSSGVRFPVLHAATCTASEARPEVGSVRFDTRILHWLSSGAVGFARGLNDTPKLVAMGAGLAAAGISTGALLLAVSGAMFAGSLVGGLRVARVLGENVVRMNDREGLMASLATAVLVGAGANFGLPMSTTHVSTGAIAGIAGRNSGRLNRRTSRDLLLAWGLTPFVSATIAALTYWTAS